MYRPTIDTTLRVRLRHRPGQLAQLATAVATEQGLLGEIVTVRLGETHTVREITIESLDDDHTTRIIEAVKAIDGVEVMEVVDPVFESHRGGKIHSTSRVRLEHVSDLRSIYTPGVARVSTAIQRDPDRAWDLTGVGGSVAIYTNGTRVLGLGDIGPLASLPVMEGKAVMYDRFVGLSATPILVDTKDPDEFVETVLRTHKGFGGIHLEDIRVPECFRIEDELMRRLEKPVMHDDQHGTAAVTLAAVINACKVAELDLRKARIGQIGLGAAGSAIASLLLSYGVGEVLVTDVSADAIGRLVERGARGTDFDGVLAGSDIVIAATGRAGLIPAARVRTGQIVFALSNPYPEIDPGVAVAAGAAFASDGRSINNILAYPGLFKGALAVRSRSITPEMKIVAAETIARLAEPGEVVPSPFSMELHSEVASRVARMAIDQGLENTLRL